MSFPNAERFDKGMAWLDRRGVAALRRALWQGVRGRVLEIGAGTGLNRPHYPAGVSLTAFDIDGESIRYFRYKHGEQAPDLSQSDAQQLPFAAQSFDMVISTLTFCSIPDPALALAEVRRVLRPDGELRLLEHVRGQNRPMALLTDLFQPLWFAMQGECHLNRDTAQAVQKAGFRLVHTTTHAWGLVQTIYATPL